MMDAMNSNKKTVCSLLVSTLLVLAPTVFAADNYLIDWDAIGEETLDHLSALIRIDTSNPPGNETQAANYLRDVLATEGIESEFYALDPERANLVAKIKGNGSKRPILIMGHTDVVGVQKDKWTFEPFSGERQDGWVYGRGSLDDKDNATATLMLLLMLKRYDVALDRDIIFLAESGEEGTPQVGINYMVEHHWDVIAAEYCLAEGGDATLMDGKVKLVGIQTTEKMPRRVTLVARGTAGHGSRPRADNAVTILAAAVAKAGSWRTPARLNSTTEVYFERMASITSGEESSRYANVSDPQQSEEIEQYFLENRPYDYSVLRTSVVPTVFDAGFRKNVIPSEASAILDIRMLPDEDVEGFYDELAKVIADPRVEIVPEDIYRPAAPVSSLDNDMFQALEKVALQMYPDATVLPMMATGATDMAQVRAKGMQAYGIGPARSIEEKSSGNGAHGDNERIAEDAMVDLVRFLWLTIIEIAATR
jgi:acetylornithine deacetylase/succinyl-diaminopimelate desuccinylase-like protein